MDNRHAFQKTDQRNAGSLQLPSRALDLAIRTSLESGDFQTPHQER